MATNAARAGWWRSIVDPVASSNDRTTVLSGRTLRIVRAAVLTVFAAAVVVYVADLFALWDETHARKYHTFDPVYGNRKTSNYYGLTAQERDLLGAATGETPGWYSAYVVIRQALVVTVSIWIAWLIYSRRPRHWMAYSTTLFILLAPLLAYPDQTEDRLAGTALYVPSEVLGWITVLVFLSFLWTFPDGRFIGSVARYVVTAVALIALVAVVGQVVDALVSLPVGAMDVVEGIWWLTLLGAIVGWFAFGVALQAWRYGRTPRDERRLARWNLAVLIAIPLWVLPFQGLHDLFSDSDVGGYTMSGFVWEQIHETLFVAAPALFAIWILFLVRRQGWWDFQTLWNRTAIHGIGLLAMAVLYGLAFGVVSLFATPLPTGVERAVAVVVATGVVVWSYGPLIRRVRAYVDERWFPRRAETDALASAFADEVRAAPDPSGTGDRLVDAVRTTLQPSHVELWTVTGEDAR
jgi:hypothetical protein